MRLRSHMHFMFSAAAEMMENVDQQTVEDPDGFVIGELSSTLSSYKSGVCIVSIVIPDPYALLVSIFQYNNYVYILLITDFIISSYEI